jgi:hypothetical protein
MGKKSRNKEFGKSGDNTIWVGSIVPSRTMEPAVQMQWGGQRALLTPQQAREHAEAVLQSIAAAEIDSCIIRWATQRLGFSLHQAGQLVVMLRLKRDAAKIPSVTINLGGGNRVTPDEARKQASFLVDAAFGVEAEAVLAGFLLEELQQETEVVEMLMDEFRQVRGVETLDVDG